MKTVSQKDLDKLKGKGWKLTPESKKAMHEQRVASTLSKQVKVIGDLVESVDSIKDSLQAKTEKDYTAVIEKLIKSLKETKEVPSVIINRSGPDGWKFIVKRTPDGLIAEIVAEKI